MLVYTATWAILATAVYLDVRRMRPRARFPLLVLAIGGLPLFPFGTVFAVTILGRLYRGPPPLLLTREYEPIVGDEPETNERTSFFTWFLLFALVLLVVILFLIAQMPPELRHLK